MITQKSKAIGKLQRATEITCSFKKKIIHYYVHISIDVEIILIVNTDMYLIVREGCSQRKLK